MVKVVRKPNESESELIRRFRKRVQKSGILGEHRRRRWFISKSELRRIEKKKAIRRLQKRRRRANRRYNRR